MDNSTLVARPPAETTGLDAEFATLLPDRAMVQMVCAPGQLAGLRALVSAGFACDLPERPGIASGGTAETGIGQSIEFAWTGPGRWLAISPSAPDATKAKLAAVVGDAASLVDVSDAYATVRLHGPLGRDALAKLVPINLDATAFQPGAVAITHARHIGVTLIHRGDGPTFDVLVARTFAAALVDWIAHN